MKAVLLLFPKRECMTGIWIVAADTNCIELDREVSVLQNNIGIIGKSRSEWNALITLLAARVNLFPCCDIQTGRLRVSAAERAQYNVTVRASD